MLNFRHYHILWSMAEKKYGFYILGPIELPDEKPYSLYQLNELGIDEAVCDKLIREGYIEVNSVEVGSFYSGALCTRYKVSPKGYEALASNSFASCKKHHPWLF